MVKTEEYQLSQAKAILQFRLLKIHNFELEMYS